MPERHETADDETGPQGVGVHHGVVLLGLVVVSDDNGGRFWRARCRG